MNDLDGMERINLQQWGERLHQRIRRSVGLPVSIGLAPNKTLAKIASKLAKKFEVYRHCCIIDNDDNRIAALKWLRKQDTVASVVGIFVSTNPFREDLLQYWKYQELRLITPTNSTIPIVQVATELLDRLFIQGLQYKRAGVIVNGISPSSPLQQDLFDVDAGQIRKLKKLDAAVDLLNKRYGSGTVVIGAQQYTKPHGEGKADVFADAIKHDHKSKNPTTRWSDVIELK